MHRADSAAPMSRWTCALFVVVAGAVACSGENGADGVPGAPAADGEDGQQGPKGPPGADGADGQHGADGTQGPPGADGMAPDGGITTGCLSPCHGFTGIVEQWKTSRHYATYIANLGGEEVAS